MNKEYNNEIGREMFKLFFGVVELGKEVRISIQNDDFQNSENKISDIFKTLIRLADNLNFDVLASLENGHNSTR